MRTRTGERVVIEVCDLDEIPSLREIARIDNVLRALIDSLAERETHAAKVEVVVQSGKAGKQARAKRKKER